MKLSHLISGICVWGVGVLLSAGQVTLAWDPNGEPEVAGYKLYYGPVSGQYDQVIDVGNVTTTTVTDLQTGGTYWFVVTAYTADGLESDPSNEINYTPLPTPPTAAVLLAFDVQRHSAEGVTATWRTGVEVDLILFRLERRQSSGDWVPVSSGLVPALGGSRPNVYQVQETGVPASGEIGYRLLAVDLWGRSRVLGEVVLRPGWQLSLQNRQGTWWVSAPVGPGSQAMLETTTDLLHGPWIPLGTIESDSPASAAVRLPSVGADPLRFFRARTESP